MGRASAAERWLRAFAPMIRAMSESLVEVSTLDGACHFAAEHGAELIDGAQCVVSIVRPDEPTTFVVAAGAGGDWSRALPGTEWPVAGTMHGRAMLTGVAVETNSAPTETATPWVFAPGRIQTGRLVPLRTGTPLPDSRIAMGVIGFWRQDAEPYDDDDRFLMDMYGEFVSVLLHRSELLQGARALADRMVATIQEVQLLQEAAGSLSTTRELDRIFQQTVSSAARILTPPGVSPRRAALLVIGDGVARVVAEEDGTGARLLHDEYPLATHHEIRSVVESAETAVYDLSVPTLNDTSLERLRPFGIMWSAMAPVVSDGRVIAILRVSSRDPEPITSEQRTLLDAIANVAAMAIGNAERYRMAQGEARRLAELEDIKSEFLRLASHELRGPLALVRGYLSMFDDGSLPTVSGAARDVLPVISGKLAQMSRMVDDMLETARLEDRRLQLTLAAIDLRDVARDVVADIPAMGPMHSMHVDICEEPLPLIADPGRIGTIVRNLLDNAVRYSPAGGGITMTVRRRGDSAVLQVNDHGIGIAPADMLRLFERFGRIVTPENSHIAGTGLGLHLSRELARMHDGDIEAESVNGVGSTFRLILPLATA